MTGTEPEYAPYEEPKGPLASLIKFCLQNRLAVLLVTLLGIAGGIFYAPFDWDLGIPRDPVPVDALPDTGENQQIVFTRWDGRSPQDVEDQITYPLTVSLMGVPGVKTIRSNSMFGFSSIYVIFEEEIDFYWSRSRILEKLASLPSSLLPEGVRPELGPDATALGQVYWYTLEAHDEKGRPSPAFRLDELRSIQDFQVRYALLAVPGVSEVASVGGYVKEYQVDVDPDALRAHHVTLDQVYDAVRRSNLDVGARTIEMNRAEYVIRGLGFIKNLKDLEESVVKAEGGVGIRLRELGNVHFGPALRRGMLDKDGAQVVGGVVVARYGANPLAVIKGIKAKLKEIEPGLPERVDADGNRVKVAVVPFYDRTGLIYETLGTLNEALAEEILITILVVLIMVLHLRSSLLISALLPLAVLFTFIAMRWGGVDANVVALSGIAIAIGTLVDMGIVLTENILKRLEEADPALPRWKVIWWGAHEVGSAVLTSTATTVISFLPVFTMTAVEGKMFKPLAFTKTFALLCAVLIAVVVLPVLAMAVLGFRPRVVKKGGLSRLFRIVAKNASLLSALVVVWFLAGAWVPLGAERGTMPNLFFTGGLVLSLLFVFRIFQWAYPFFLATFLRTGALFLLVPLSLAVMGATIWLGFDKTLGWLPGLMPTETLQKRVASLGKSFPGLGKEFLPRFDEGAFLFMPTTMPHAGTEETVDVLAKLDRLIRSVPEVEWAVGKAGRVESALDPAPISMIETVIQYKPEYRLGKSGHRIRFRYDEEKEEFVRDAQGNLIPDSGGRPFRQWRKHIKTPHDIWNEIQKVAKLPGTSSAPYLQPIEARLVMLQTGMRAPMGVKVQGPDLKTVERVGIEIERLLKEVPEIQASAVIADRILGKPYLEIELDRDALSRYGIPIRKATQVIEVAIGGKPVTLTVEGRERYPVRIRYFRELRNNPDEISKVLIHGADGTPIPIGQLARINFIRGPQSIKSEDTFLTGYVLFDKKPGISEVEAVEAADRYLKEAIAKGDFHVPAGVSYRFAGNYENQVRSEQRLKVVLPLALVLIFLLLYFQFRSSATTLMVFSGVVVAWSGGFLMIWLYGLPGFLDFDIFGTSMRELFQIKPIQLSVAVWVGFLALFGISTDDGVVMATYLKQSFERNRPVTKEGIREAVLEAGKRRIRPCLMTAGTTILALLPVLSSRGKGADILVPMAIPSFGGMVVQLLTLFVVPVLYCSWETWKLRLKIGPYRELREAA